MCWRDQTSDHFQLIKAKNAEAQKKDPALRNRGLPKMIRTLKQWSCLPCRRNPSLGLSGGRTHRSTQCKCQSCRSCNPRSSSRTSSQGSCLHRYRLAKVMAWEQEGWGLVARVAQVAEQGPVMIMSAQLFHT